MFFFLLFLYFCVAVIHIDVPTVFIFIIMASVTLVLLFFFINNLMYVVIASFCLNGINGITRAVSSLLRTISKQCSKTFR
jgi:hypothetical protein